MHVERVSEPGEEWDTFAEATPGARLGHAAAWARVLRDAYSLEPLYLAARTPAGAQVGGLPLVRFRTVLGGSELISLPYLDAAGILAHDSEAERALTQAAQQLMRSEGARALELRQARLPTAAAEAGPPGVDRVDLVLRLEDSVEAQWQALRGKVRNQTRKAEREGLVLAEGTREALLPEFYGPFQVNMRDLGSPVHALGFFEAACRHFGDRLRVIVTRLGERPVGGLLAIRYAATVSVPWASTLRSERARCPNNLIYWEALRWAVEQGAREFDFGRSPIDSGTHRFKLGWGASEQPLDWTRFAPSGEQLPMVVGREGGLLARLSELWTHLPVTVAGALGPRLRRYFSN